MRTMTVADMVTTYNNSVPLVRCLVVSIDLFWDMSTNSDYKGRFITDLADEGLLYLFGIPEFRNHLLRRLKMLLLSDYWPAGGSDGLHVVSSAIFQFLEHVVHIGGRLIRVVIRLAGVMLLLILFILLFQWFEPVVLVQVVALSAIALRLFDVQRLREQLDVDRRVLLLNAVRLLADRHSLALVVL